jgi:dTDP-glucose 4,6-dehydratase
MRASNTFGPHNSPEKVLPVLITHVLGDRPILIYRDGRQRHD